MTVVWPHRANTVCERTEKSQASSQKEGAALAKVRVIMAGGGTGGHLYPGLAVAEALQEKLGGAAELVWAATPRQVDQRLLAGFGENYVAQPVQPLVKKIGKLWAFWRGWRKSCAYWKAEFEKHRPDAVLALGGYAAGPAAYVAGKFGVPVALLNPDALPGLANRFLLTRAERVFVQWDLPAAYYGKIRGRVMPLGCPIRHSLFGVSRHEGATKLGLDPRKLTLVVTGASLGAKTINDAVVEMLKNPAMAAAFAPAGTWQILHLTGMEQAATVSAAYAALGDLNAKVLDYCDDMASVWACADLAIARAGASTCAELTACGVPAILLPYPYHKDLHQRANAQELAKAGAAIIVDDQKEPAGNAAAIQAELTKLLYDAPTRERMAEAARVAGKPDAAREIAEEILSLVRSKSR